MNTWYIRILWNFPVSGSDLLEYYIQAKTKEDAIAAAKDKAFDKWGKIGGIMTVWVCYKVKNELCN